jgi:Flp pilus assembly protein TadG
MNSSPRKATSESTPTDEQRRGGMVIVMFSIMLVALIGMLGLVIDTGFMLATHRQAQNAADAAALAAAVERINGFSESKAEAVAAKFVTDYNGLSSATGPFLNFPPTSGPYAGDPGAVEAIVTTPLQTFFIHILGVSQDQNVSARAVAIWNETSTAGAGVIVLDPDARPGLNVSGGGVIRVDGIVFDNSEGGGETETGVPIDNGNNGTAASGGQPNSDTGIFAKEFRVVGGVDYFENFKPFTPGEPNNLKTGQTPLPDPFLNLATPTTSNGVRNVDHGAVTVTDTGSSLTGSPDPAGENTYDIITGKAELYPGLYSDISINGGEVLFHPGIYVIRGGQKSRPQIDRRNNCG